MRAGWFAVLGADEQQHYLLLEFYLAVGSPFASTSINSPAISPHCYFRVKKAKVDVYLLKSGLIDCWITGTPVKGFWSGIGSRNLVSDSGSEWQWQHQAPFGPRLSGSGLTAVFKSHPARTSLPQAHLIIAHTCTTHQRIVQR